MHWIAELFLVAHGLVHRARPAADRVTGVDTRVVPFQGAGLKAVKTVHTLAWFTIEAAMVYVLYSGIRGRSDRRAGVAGAVVLAETAIFAGNGFHCPLTAVAQRLGDSAGSVTDIYLPKWFAHNLPAIHVPLIVLAVAVHWRNLRRQSRRSGPALPREYHRRPSKWFLGKKR